MIVNEALETTEKDVSIGGSRVKIIKFLDDQALVWGG